MCNLLLASSTFSIFTTHAHIQHIYHSHLAFARCRVVNVLKASVWAYLLLIFSVFTTHARLQRLQRKAIYHSYLLIISTTHMLAFSARLSPKRACTKRRSYLLLIFTIHIYYWYTESHILCSYCSRACTKRCSHSYLLLICCVSYLLLIFTTGFVPNVLAPEDAHTGVCVCV